MANEILDTGTSILSLNDGGSGTGDGKVKCRETDTADYLANKLYSSNDSLSIEYIPSTKKLSITENNSYEAVISPACPFPIMNCNSTLNLTNYNKGIGSVDGHVMKINLPSGNISSITLFGGGNSSNSKHLYFALYGSDLDDVRTAQKFGEKLNATSSNFSFDFSNNPVHIDRFKFYWIMVVVCAESDGGDKINGITTNITGAGIGTWQSIAGIGMISNPFSAGVQFLSNWDYTINYSASTIFPYVQCNIMK